MDCRESSLLSGRGKGGMVERKKEGKEGGEEAEQ